jgi:hypothetical protein
MAVCRIPVSMPEAGRTHSPPPPPARADSGLSLGPNDVLHTRYGLDGEPAGDDGIHTRWHQYVAASMPTKR